MTCWTLLMALLDDLRHRPADNADMQPTEKLLVGYYASWRCYGSQEQGRGPYLPADIQAQHFTHINYAFAKINDQLQIDYGDEWTDIQKEFEVTGPDGIRRTYKGMIEMFNGDQSPVRARNANIQVLIAIGGWSFSDKFSDAVATDRSRNRLAQSIAEFVARHGFDGVDIDWEYPCVKGHEHNKISERDGANLTEFLLVLRQHLSQAGARLQRPRPYALTMATSASRWSYDHLQLNRLSDIVDWCHIMCYDASGPWSDGIDHHAPLIPLITNAVQDYIQRGIPPYKLCIGIPLYGRTFVDVQEPVIGCRFASVPDGDGIVDYDTIAKEQYPYEEHIHERYGGAVSLWHPHKRVWISAEAIHSAIRKAAWIRDNHLRGL